MPWPMFAQFGEAFGTLSTLFWIWMFCDCLGNSKLRNQWYWFFFIIFTHVFGALVYLVLVKLQLGPLIVGKAKGIYQNALDQQSPRPYYTPPTPYTPPASSAEVPVDAPSSRSAYQEGYQEQRAAYTSSEESASPYADHEYELPQASYPEPPLQQQG